MTALALPWQPATDLPRDPGWYVVKVDTSDRPLVLWWSSLSTQWRDGSRLVNAVAWLGPVA
jgi:hypothetical protein